MSLYNRIKTLILYSRTRGIVLLFFGILLKSTVEVIGVASITPFVSVMVNPAIVHTNVYLNSIYQYFEFKNTTSFLNYLGFLTLVLLLLTNILSATMEWMIIRFSKVMEYRLSTQLMTKYLSNTYAFFLENNSSKFGKNIISEVQRCIDGVIFPLMVAISRTMTVLFIVSLLIVVEPYAAISMSVLFGGGYVLIFVFVRKRLFELGRLSSESMLNRFKTINEAFLGVKDIKLRGIENKFINRYNKSAKRQAHYYVYQHVVSTIPRYVLDSLAFGGVVLVMLFLVNQGNSSQNIIPIVALYAVAGYRLIPALQNIYSSIVTLKFNTPALKILTDDLRSDDFHNKYEKVDLPLLKFREGLNLKSVSYKFSNTDQYAINNISINIKPNTTIGIVGSTGSGKTTLVDIILGLLINNSGQLIIDNVELKQSNIHLWQKKIGYMPQNIFLIDDTVSANIAFGLNTDEIELDRVINAARVANLHDFIVELPDGYDTKIGEQGARLSGGERQRIGIARTLYNNPEIIVLDEGTSSLDTVTESIVMDAIHSLSDEKTIILIAHRLSTVKDCDIIYLLHDGEIEDFGTYDELIMKSQKFKKMTGDNNIIL